MARSWHDVPQADPDGQTIAFPAVVAGRDDMVTAIAYSNQVDLWVAGKRIEIQLDVWESVAPYLTIAAHMRRPT